MSHVPMNSLILSRPIHGVGMLILIDISFHSLQCINMFGFLVILHTIVFNAVSFLAYRNVHA